MPTLGTAYVQIVPSAEGISGDLTKALGGPSRKAGGKSGALIGSAMKRFITAAGIGLAIKKSVEEGAKLEQSLGGIETLYKNHANTVIKNANKAYRTAGLSANDYMENVTSFSASLIKSMGGDTQKAAKWADIALRDMSDNANKMGTDMGSITQTYQSIARGNYGMLDNLKLGYGGTKAEMEKLMADAEKLTGEHYTVGDFGDSVKAIHAIQDELGITGTTAKESASTLSGSFNSMKAAASNFLGNLALGKDIGPSLNGLITSASTFLFDNLIPAVINIARSLPSALFEGIKVGLPIFISKLPSLINQIFTAAVDIVDQISAFISSAVENIGNDPGIAKGGLKIIGKIVLGILKGAGRLAIAVFKLNFTIVKSIGKLVGKMLGAVLSAMRSKLSAIVSAVKKKFNAAKEAMLAPIRAAREKLSNILGKIKSKFNSLRLKLHLKIPRVTLSGGKAPWGIAGKGRLPSFRVRWMAKGGIVDGATLIGAGEAGKEAIVPLDPFWKKLENTKQTIDYDALGEAVARALARIQLTSIIEIDGKQIARATAKDMLEEIKRLQGHTGRKYGYV